MIATRCLRADETFSSFGAAVLFRLAGTIPRGLMVETAGLAERAVSCLMDLVGASGLRLLLGGPLPLHQRSLQQGYRHPLRTPL